jgi:hypothetical protein
MSLHHLTFTVDEPGTLTRSELLDRRDELVDALKAAGLRVSFTVDGTEVYLSDEGAPTVADVLAEKAMDTIDRAVADGHLPG